MSSFPLGNTFESNERDISSGIWGMAIPLLQTRRTAVHQNTKTGSNNHSNLLGLVMITFANDYFGWQCVDACPSTSIAEVFYLYILYQ